MSVVLFQVLCVKVLFCFCLAFYGTLSKGGTPLSFAGISGDELYSDGRLLEVDVNLFSFFQTLSQDTGIVTTLFIL